MKGEVRIGTLTVAVAALLACGFAACSNAASDEHATTAEAAASTEGASMAASSGETTEGAGEHREGSEIADRAGEHREGSEATAARGEHGEGGESRERGEHEGEGAEGHDEGGGEGEEGGIYINRGDTWDTTRKGARLVLTYDAASASFKGRVENTTASTLCSVRVEVHLAGGTELGPTERVDLRAGQSTEIVLPTAGANVATWTAHPEVSACSG